MTDIPSLTYRVVWRHEPPNPRARSCGQCVGAKSKEAAEEIAGRLAEQFAGAGLTFEIEPEGDSQ